MTTRAKFDVSSVSTVDRGAFKQYVVKMSPAYNNGPENKAFWDATPAGNIELTLNSAEVAAQFVPGKAYFVDFTPA